MRRCGRRRGPTTHQVNITPTAPPRCSTESACRSLLACSWVNLIRDRTSVLRGRIMFSKSSRSDKNHKLVQVYLKRLPFPWLYRLTWSWWDSCEPLSLKVLPAAALSCRLASGVQHERVKPSNLISNEKICSKMEQLFLYVSVTFCVVAQNLKKQSPSLFFQVDIL